MFDRARSRTALLAAAAAVVLTLATPVATWWVAGDQSVDIPDPDYAFRAPDISTGVEHAIGVTAVVLWIVSAVLVCLEARGGRFPARWWSIVIPLVLAGFICGYGYRVMTAGVIGANIGAGLAIFFGGPAVVMLVGWAIFRSLVPPAR
jgi:hypothetical protein